MDGQYFCGLSETLVTEELKRWPVAKWWLDGQLARIPRDPLRHSIQQAFEAWSKVANVKGEEATLATEADLLIRSVRLDAPGGVLADCELPGPRIQHMRLDDYERWVIQLGPDVANNVIDLERVLIHELGHFWGMGHAPQGSANLMAPTYARSIWEPQEWEIKQMLGLYGKPLPKPLPPTTPTDPGVDLPDEIWIKGKSGAWTGAWKLGDRIA